MSLIETARKTLTELPISDVLRERLSLVLDETASLERKVDDVKTELAESRAELKIAKAEEEKARKAVEALKKEHEEEILISHCVEFRRGKRTGGKWLAFCPKCGLPVVPCQNREYPPYCTDTANCNWSAHEPSHEQGKFMKLV